MAAKEFSSPEHWANNHADNMAKTIRSKAARAKLPKAGLIGADRLLKIAREIWGVVSSHTHASISSEVERKALEWAGVEAPRKSESCARIPSSIDGKVYARYARGRDS